VGIDEANKIEYRRINRYFTPLKIPITTHPGEAKSSVTWSSISHSGIFPGFCAMRDL